MEYRILGIDPGVTGAFAGIVIKDGLIEKIDMWDMPLVKIKTGKNEVDPMGALDVLVNFGPDHTFIEKAQPMSRFGKKQGVASTGGYMKGYGILIGLLASQSEFSQYTEVTPQAWKKVMLSEAGLDKTASRVRAGEVCPGLKFPLVKDHNKAEALLIGIYGRTVLGW